MHFGHDVVLRGFESTGKDTVEVGDSVKKENVSRVWKNVKTRTIRGKVLSGTDKKPKGGAMVSTHGISGYSTLTEEDGTFKLDLPVFASSIDVSSPDDHLVEVGLRSTEEQPLIFYILRPWHRCTVRKPIS